MNSSSGYIGRAENSAVPQTPLGGTIGELELHLNDLGIAAEQMHLRLSGSVLRPDNVTAMAGSAKQAEPPRVQMSETSERIAAITERVKNITAQLQNALDRLEA